MYLSFNKNKVDYYEVSGYLHIFCKLFDECIVLNLTNIRLDDIDRISRFIEEYELPVVFAPQDDTANALLKQVFDSQENLYLWRHFDNSIWFFQDLNLGEDFENAVIIEPSRINKNKLYMTFQKSDESLFTLVKPMKKKLKRI